MDEQLTPEQEERVRRLLAEARHTEPIPDDVVARLDRALTEEAGRSESGAGTSAVPAAAVVRLADRRRNAGRLLLAAAVVVVGGVALGQVVGSSGQSGDSGSASDSGLQDRLRAPERAESGASSSDSPSQDVEPGAVSGSMVTLSKAPPQRVRSERFARVAARLRPVATGGTKAADEASRNDAQASGPRSALVAETCRPGVWGGGRYLRVAVDGDAGWLVYRPPRGDTEVVDLFLCGEADPERSTTIPLR